MSPDSPPTLGEVLRRLDDVTRQLQHTTDDMRRDREQQARTYVRQDVYSSDKRSEELARMAIASDTEDLEHRLDKGEAFRRQIMAGAAVAAIGLVMNLVLALSAFLASKGA